MMLLYCYDRVVVVKIRRMVRAKKWKKGVTVWLVRVIILMKEGFGKIGFCEREDERVVFVIFKNEVAVLSDMRKKLRLGSKRTCENFFSTVAEEKELVVDDLNCVGFENLVGDVGKNYG